MASAISLGFEVNDGNFKTALKAIDSEIKAMDEGIKAATKEMEVMGDSEETAAKRSELLTKMLDAQHTKLDALRGEYEKSSAKLAELQTALEKAKESGDPEAIARATNAYNKQRTEVANLESQMNKTSAGIADTTAKMQESGEASDDLSGKVEALGNKFDLSLAKQGIDTAKEALTNFAKSVADASKAVWDMASDASTAADDMLTLSTQTGISTKALQEYAYASRFVDTEVSTITGSLTKLTKNMGSSSKDVAAAFDTLRVSTTDSAGAMRDSEAVFWDCIDALGSVQNATERDQLAMTLFGKSAQQLNPLIEAGSAKWREYCDEANDAGLILSEEGVGALGAFNDGLQRVEATMDAAKNQIFASLAPAFESIATAVANVAQEFTKWVQTDEAQAMLTGIADKVVALVQEMSQNLGPAIEMAKEAFSRVAEGIRFVVENSDLLVTAFKLLGGAIVALEIAQFAAAVASLANPIGAVILAVSSLAAIVVANMDRIQSEVTGAWDAIQSVWSVAQSFFTGLWDGITAVFADAGARLGQELTTAWQTIQTAWSVATQYFAEIWAAVTSVFDGAASWFGDKFKSAWQAVSAVWDGVKQYFAGIWTGITGTFDAANSWFGQKFTAAWQAIQTAWSGVGQYFAQVWQTIVSAFDNGPAKMLQIGKSLISGIWEGIKSMSGWIGECITNFASEYIAGPIKKFFGIASPSKYMRDEIGTNLGLGVVEGILGTKDQMQEAYKAMIPDVGSLSGRADTISVAYNVQSAQGGSGIVWPSAADDRPIILKLNDRELGRAVRGYA